MCNRLHDVGSNKKFSGQQVLEVQVQVQVLHTYLSTTEVQLRQVC